MYLFNCFSFSSLFKSPNAREKLILRTEKAEKKIKKRIVTTVLVLSLTQCDDLYRMNKNTHFLTKQKLSHHFKLFRW